MFEMLYQDRMFETEANTFVTSMGLISDFALF